MNPDQPASPNPEPNPIPGSNPGSQLPPPPTVPPPFNAASPPPPDPQAQARMWHMICHLSALAMCIGIPFGNLIGPFIIWQIKKNEFPSIDAHGKAALNFQITVTLAVFLAGAATLLLSFFCIGHLLIPLVFLIALSSPVCAIIAGIKAHNGEPFNYPCAVAFLK